MAKRNGNIKAIFGTELNDVLKGDHTDGDTIYGLGGNDKITALNGNDFIYGGDGNDQIFAAGGNDLIWGGLGNDYIDGGAGNDTVAYTDATGAVTVDLAITTAQNTGGYGIDTLLRIENLISGSDNDTLRGNSFANKLSAGDGNDYIDGRGGNDELNGGSGADTIFGGDGNDIITTDGGIAANDFVDGGAGIDTLDYLFAVQGVTSPLGGLPGVNVNLSITTAQDTGAAGFDTIINVENIQGSMANDVLTGNTANNNIFGGAGADSVSGGAGDDVLNGFTGSDIVFGGEGNDVIDGGMTGVMGEIDTLVGGTGADRFFFENIGYSWVGATDQILDFSTFEGDKIDVHSVFSLLPVTTGSFIGQAAFSGVMGQVQVIKTFGEPGLGGVNQLVNIDYDGNGAADFSLAVVSNSLLSATDFIL
jgi:Ca2+-binding RTX toxin-like protein